MNTPSPNSSISSKNENDPEALTPTPVQSSLKKQNIVLETDSLGPNLELLSLLSHLNLFAVIGVLIRFGLDQFLGPPVAGITDDDSIIFIDLPPNMVGSFIMGFVGFVFKKDLIEYSEHLALGLSTGLCGSITTFASWNQQMLAMTAKLKLHKAIFRYVLGAALSYVAFTTGADLAQYMKSIIENYTSKHSSRRAEIGENFSQEEIIASKMSKLTRKWVYMLFFLTLSCLMWVGCVIGILLDVKCLKSRRLLMACTVACLGVWTRWYLSRFNFIGLGRNKAHKWFPVGTFLTNVSAASLESVLAIVNIAVGNKQSNWIIGGINLGFFGCMSTVSTLVVESHNLYTSDKKSRSYIYYFMTVGCSVILGVLFYCLPIWTVASLKSSYNFVEKC